MVSFVMENVTWGVTEMDITLIIKVAKDYLSDHRLIHQIDVKILLSFNRIFFFFREKTFIQMVLSLLFLFALFTYYSLKKSVS